MDEFEKLLFQDCLEFDEVEKFVNCLPLSDFEESFKCIPLEEDPENALRMKVVAGFYIGICFVGLVTNIVFLISLFWGGKQGSTFKAPSTILIANLGAVGYTAF